MSRGTVLPPALLFLLLANAPLSTATGADLNLAIDLAPGYDTNPLELPEGKRSALFTELALDMGMRGEWTPVWGFFLDLDGSARFHGSDLSDADRGWADLRAGLTLTPYRAGSRGFAIAFGGSYGVHRSTYIDPATGEPYEMSDGIGLVPVPDRFDLDSTGLFTDLRWRVQRRVLLYLDTELRRRSYVKDYSETTALEPLDDRTLSAEPGLLVDLSDRMRLDVSLELNHREYDGLSALDENALPVAEARREYDSVRYKLALSFEPAAGIAVAVGLRSTDREDLHAGYYDYRGTTLFTVIDYALSAATRIDLTVAQRDLNYDNATIDNTINGETRDSRRLLASGRAEHDVAGHLTLFVEAGLDRSDNRDPLFTYDREWALAGVRFGL